MTGKPMTQSDRLTRIEVLLEAAVSQRVEDRDAMRKTIEEMASDVRQIKADLAADKAELAALKNKGFGLLLGAGLAGGATWEAIKALFGAMR
jgi:endonuclease III